MGKNIELVNWKYDQIINLDIEYINNCKKGNILFTFNENKNITNRYSITNIENISNIKTNIPIKVKIINSLGSSIIFQVVDILKLFKLKKIIQEHKKTTYIFQNIYIGGNVKAEDNIIGNGQIFKIKGNVTVTNNIIDNSCNNIVVNCENNKIKNLNKTFQCKSLSSYTSLYKDSCKNLCKNSIVQSINNNFIIVYGNLTTKDSLYINGSLISNDSLIVNGNLESYNLIQNCNAVDNPVTCNCFHYDKFHNNSIIILDIDIKDTTVNDINISNFILNFDIDKIFILSQ